MTDAELLQQLLESWRTTRDPITEDAIVRLGRRATPRRKLFDPPYAGEKLERAWLELAARVSPLDVEELLGAPWPAEWASQVARMTALVAFAPDPRIARKVAAVAQHYPIHEGSHRAFHRTVAKILLAAATPAILPWLDAVWPLGSTHVHTEEFYPVRAAIDALVMGTPDPALLAAVNLRIGDGAAVAALWEEHARRPEDLELRAILADALEAAGDPRGEYLQLALAIEAGRAPPGSHATAERLLAPYRIEWTGPLPLLEHAATRFARGFPCKVRTSARDRHLERALDRPEWLTLEELDVSTLLTAPDLDLSPFVRRLPHLRRFSIRLPAAELPAVIGTEPFPQLHGLGVFEGFPSYAQFPRLRILRTSIGEQVEHDLQLAASLGIQALVLGARHLRQLIAARRAGPPELRCVLDHEQGFVTNGWWLRIPREGDVADVIQGAGQDMSRIVGVFENTDIRRIRAHVSPADAADAQRRFHHALLRARQAGLDLAFDGRTFDLGG